MIIESWVAILTVCIPLVVTTSSLPLLVYDSPTISSILWNIRFRMSRNVYSVLHSQIKQATHSKVHRIVLPVDSSKYDLNSIEIE